MRLTGVTFFLHNNIHRKGRAQWPMLDSGDRVQEFISWSRKSGFFLGCFLLLSSYLSLSLSDCTGIILDHKVTCSGRDKERKKLILAAPSVGEHRNKCDVWEKRNLF